MGENGPLRLSIEKNENIFIFFVRQHAEEDNSNFLHLQSILPHLATQSINQSASSIHQSHPAGKPEEGRRSDPVHAYSAIKEETASPSQVGIFIVPQFWTPPPSRSYDKT